MDYVVAIPSHNRTKVIDNKTLKLLRHYNIDPERVYVFVAPEEYNEYKKKIAPEYNLVEGALGIKENRKAISDYFDEDQPILCLDDDIKWICQMFCVRGGRQRLDKIKCLETLIFDVFEKLEEEQCNLAGFYPIDNPFFMKQHISNDLRFIIGNCKFFFNKKKLENRKFTLLEDFETTMKYYLEDGKVIRYNNFVCVTNYKILKWNLSAEDKKLEVDLFHHKYKEFTSIKHKVNGNCDIKFIKNPPRIYLSTLWIGKTLNELSRLSFISWIKQGYSIKLYSNLKLNELNINEKYLKYIDIKNPNQVCLYNNEDILPFSDYWRYNLLLKDKNAIWIDADMVLIDRLPTIDTIISSEHTFQSGAFKSKLNFVPNIGVLKFTTDLGREFIEEIINKIDNKKTESKFCDNMTIFRTTIKKNKYIDLFNNIMPPFTFCPIPWWNVTSIYNDVHYPIKYDVENKDNKYIIRNGIGIHLWNYFTMNKYQIDFKSITEHSLFDQLKNLCL